MYTTALNIALEHQLESIAFPLISSGIFGYPKDQALSAAIAAIGKFLLEHDMKVYLVVFDKAAYLLNDKLFRSIKSYIDDNYADLQIKQRRKRTSEISFQLKETSEYEDTSPTVSQPAQRYLDELVIHPGESFSQMLLRLIDERGKTDVEIYKRANLDRKLFSKIHSNPQYKPSKNTALALAVALQLNLNQTANLLRRAGFALSPSNRFDLIVGYFIREGNFNIFEINEALFAFDESLLGGVSCATA